MRKKVGRRPAAESSARLGIVAILFPSADPAYPPVSKRVTALIFGDWHVHAYDGPMASGHGFSVSHSGRSLNAFCPDMEWADACRIALRLATDFPDLDLDEIDIQMAMAVTSAVAEALVGT